MGMGIFSKKVFCMLFLLIVDGLKCVITIRTCSLLVILKQLKIEFLFNAQLIGQRTKTQCISKLHCKPSCIHATFS